MMLEQSTVSTGNVDHNTITISGTDIFDRIIIVLMTESSVVLPDAIVRLKRPKKSN